jgi:hypothetical protein
MFREEKNTSKDLISPEDREQLLIQNLSMYPTIKEAAINAGYSESYAKSNVYRLIKKPEFQSRLKQYYRVHNTALLPRILEAETKLIEKIVEDPEKLSKHHTTIKQIKQASGILEPDDTPKQPMINIKSLQELSLKVLNAPPGESFEQIMDAEVTDIEE